MKHNPLYLFFILLTYTIGAQVQPLNLEDIHNSRKFSAQGVYGINWMNDGRYYSKMTFDKGSQKVIKSDILTDKEIETIVDSKDLKLSDGNPLNFESYSFSADESKLLLQANRESIYRRSYKAEYYLYDRETKALIPLEEGEKISYATYSPDGNKVAYVKENNLYIYDIASKSTTPITNDGEFNKLIHGAADWVYEEEFGFAKAFKWSSDSKSIAFLSFDEEDVKEYNMQIWGELYPQDYKFKYPKAGEKNSEISLTVYDVANGNKTNVDLGSEKDIYVPRFYWTPDSKLVFTKLNRLQNHMNLMIADENGKATSILEEKSDTYVDVEFTDELIFIDNGKKFIKTSEISGFKHIYLYNIDGSLVKQITDGDWEVSSLYGYDADSKTLYFSSREVSPLENHLYSIKINGKSKKQLTTESGWHGANFSTDFKYYIANYSSVEHPGLYRLYKSGQKTEMAVLEDNAKLIETIENYYQGKHSFFSFTTPEGIELNGYEILPADFDPSKKYPVLMYVYGGPGSQTVMNRAGGSREKWFHYLAQQGYIVVSVDNRGTGGRGKEFKHVTYKNLGKYEVQDQISAAKYLVTKDYVDASRIGIFGWSYGGYMSSNCLFIGNDVFSTAVAVAPVTTWRYYDTIYTERYLQRPQDNPEGYDENSPITHAAKLEGNFLLIHGTADDNVHFQNAVDLQTELINQGKHFDSFYYPNKNHGIYGGNTRLHLFTLITKYLDNNLKAEDNKTKDYTSGQ
ncbi:S9 family peptidase [Marinigracilibium pacificum]|uniref:S9 family peptidase n=1 Tax=Marinigracilibium pacificum TaxID=2729599 RepID=A0A848IVX7_9BACT|nr:S9 family peptidase [Marinigracilibium pacificum]NMM47401.1 S9 family peptidase [Marinigracilibium pacificum]